MILGVSAENQVMIAEKMDKNNCAINLGWFKNLSIETYLCKFTELIKNFNRRQEYGINAKRILKDYSPDNILTEMGI